MQCTEDERTGLKIFKFMFQLLWLGFSTKYCMARDYM